MVSVFAEIVRNSCPRHLFFPTSPVFPEFNPVKFMLGYFLSSLLTLPLREAVY